jgi:thioredoxin reductase (NADPH)
MNELVFDVSIYGALVSVIVGSYLVTRHGLERRSRSIQSAATEAGLTEPASLHPIIDKTLCIGCGACMHACPETGVLGRLNGKAELIEPSSCIGHGACRTACPVDAITLVFGTEKRGVDIPNVSPSFESNVPGIFIAGELGGMGLIRNAIEQGRQAVESIRALLAKGAAEAELDLVIVGAGPAGFSATLAAKQHGLRAVTIEQDTLGGTVAHFPRGKVVMTAPAILPLHGKVTFRETTKETLLSFWQSVEEKTKIKINYEERVEKIEAAGGTISVKTTSNSYRTRTVLLAIGRRGTPRKLGAIGEDSPKVVYRLLDPEQYKGKHVLVVGGGDSALEAAHSTAAVEGTTVTLSYRSDAFGRAKVKNRQKVDAAIAAKRLRVLLKSSVKEIRPNEAILDVAGEIETIPNDAIIVCAGGILPTQFLKDIGINVETKYGTE